MAPGLADACQQPLLGAEDSRHILPSSPHTCGSHGPCLQITDRASKTLKLGLWRLPKPTEPGPGTPSYAGAGRWAASPQIHHEML